MSTPLRLLFLHGYTQSGPLFHAKTKALEKLVLKTLPRGSMLFFPTAPHLLKLSDLPGQSENGNEENGDNWAWWRKNDATGEYTGLDETWGFLSSYLDTNGPFDGCVGFSQGAALAAMLVSLLEPSRPAHSRPPSFATGHPPLKFGIAYSGFRAPGPRYDYFYQPKITTPILHFLGSLDTVVDEGRSLALVEACEGGGKMIVYHPGGHYLPAGKQFVNVMLRFVVDAVEEKVEGKVKESVVDEDVLF